MTEVWKQVIDWEGFYEVSDHGNVKSLSRVVSRGSHKLTVCEKILKKTVGERGYFTVRLSRNSLGKNIYVHRLVGLTFIDASWCGDFDHHDLDPLNNLLSNLRKATRSQNKANMNTLQGTSKYKGVCFGKRRNKWRATITVNYKSIYLGQFPTQEQAAQVYNKAALQHFGEFARINEI